MWCIHAVLRWNIRCEDFCSSYRMLIGLVGYNFIQQLPTQELVIKNKTKEESYGWKLLRASL